MSDTKADAIQVGGNHYKDMGVQPWDLMEAALTKEEFVGFLKGTASSTLCVLGVRIATMRESLGITNLNYKKYWRKDESRR